MATLCSCLKCSEDAGAMLSLSASAGEEDGVACSTGFSLITLMQGHMHAHKHTHTHSKIRRLKKEGSLHAIPCMGSPSWQSVKCSSPGQGSLTQIPGQQPHSSPLQTLDPFIPVPPPSPSPVTQLPWGECHIMALYCCN